MVTDPKSKKHETETSSDELAEDDLDKVSGGTGKSWGSDGGDGGDSNPKHLPPKTGGSGGSGDGGDKARGRILPEIKFLDPAMKKRP